MNKSYSKIRHVKQSNLLLEKSYMNERVGFFDLLKYKNEMKNIIEVMNSMDLCGDDGKGPNQEDLNTIYGLIDDLTLSMANDNKMTEAQLFKEIYNRKGGIVFLAKAIKALIPSDMEIADFPKETVFKIQDYIRNKNENGHYFSSFFNELLGALGVTYYSC